MPQELVRYAELLGLIKQRIRQGQTRAVFSANAELISMYWDIGRMLHDRQQEEGWGSAVIPRLSRDIRNELSEVKGFSERNIRRMIAFYRAYPSLGNFLPQAVAKKAKGGFKPEYAGKMNFYCNVVDDRLRHEGDNPTIGLILCQDKKSVLAEYTLRGVAKPIGVSEYELTRALPENLKSALPSIEEIEREMSYKAKASSGKRDRKKQREG